MTSERKLPQKMREAADILEEVDKLEFGTLWNAHKLRIAAERLEREDLKNRLVKVIENVHECGYSVIRAATAILDNFTVTPK